MTRTSDTTSLSDLRRNLRGHLRRAKGTGRPLFVTTNGQTDAVVLRPDAFDALAARAELTDSLVMLDASQRDIDEGRTEDANGALSRIAGALGLDLAR